MGMWGIIIVCWAVALVLFDVTRRRLPNALTLPALALTLGWCLVHDPSCLWGAVLWAGLYVLISALLGGVGAGDIKLAPTLGMWLAPFGLLAVLQAVALASVLSLAGGVVLLARRSEARPREVSVPHGPGMLCATGIVWLWHGCLVVP